MDTNPARTAIVADLIKYGIIVVEVDIAKFAPVSPPTSKATRNRRKIIPPPRIAMSIKKLNNEDKRFSKLFFITTPPYINRTGKNSAKINMATTRWINTHITASLEVSPISDSAIPIAAYIAKAKGGVIPSNAPVIAGSIAATNNGFAPTATKAPNMPVPKMAI